jgi:hypothetical protein
MSNSSRIRTLVTAVGLAAAAFSMSAFASVTTVPQSALVASGQYYTDMVGGGIGSPLLMTGGGSNANAGSSRNDDGFSGPIDLGFTLSFFGQDYTQFWANNNGNISFQDGIAAFTPTGPQGAAVPIISPFFADVDTRNSASGLMYLRTDIPNEIIVTWDAVGYYDSNADLLNSFQLVLRGPDYSIPSGEGAIGFFYKDMQWETGSASGGSHGFGGTPAAVGFGNGSGDGEVLAGSTEDGISGVVANHYIWFDQNLAPVTPPPTGVPEPAALGMFGLGMLLIGGFMALRRRPLRA